MTRRARVLAYGGTAALIVAGIVCAAVITGGAGPLVAVGLVGLGLIALISLVFLEVGLSEDQDRARTEAIERERSTAKAPGPRPAPRSLPRRSLRLERMRGRRRRLR